MARTPYITKDDLLNELALAKERYRSSNVELTRSECMSRRMADMFMMMVKRFSKQGKWAGYTYLDDMQSEALLTLCRNYYKFDEQLYDNPFAYYSQIIYTSFLNFLAKEHKQRDTKDNLSIAIGLRPSYAAQLKSDATSRE